MRLSQARSVLHHSQALADNVMAKRTGPDVALATGEEEQRIGQSIDQKMAELRAKASDIADLVDDERLYQDRGGCAVPVASATLRRRRGLPVLVRLPTGGRE
jgi:hypothetical protein